MYRGVSNIIAFIALWSAQLRDLKCQTSLQFLVESGWKKSKTNKVAALEARDLTGPKI